MATYTDAQLQQINIRRTASPGSQYTTINGDIYEGQLDGSLKYLSSSFNKRAQKAVGDILQSTDNISLNYNEDQSEITSDLEDTGVVAGTYGDGDNIPEITIDEFGRVREVNIIPVNDQKVKASSADTTSGYLNQKVAAGSNISLVILNPGANEQIQINSTATSSDEKVKVSATDTTEGYLGVKVVAGTNVTLNVLNPGANEQIEIVASAPAALRDGGFGASFTGSGGVVTTGSKGKITIPFGFTITNWFINGDVSGSCVVDIKVAGVSIIGAGNKPTLSAASSANSAVSGWTTTIFVEDTTFEWNVDSCSTISEIDLTIKVTKAI